MNDVLVEFIILTLAFLGLGVFVFFFTAKLQFKHKEQQFLDVRKTSISALVALFIGWVAVSGLFWLFSLLGDSGGEPEEYRFGNVISQFIVSSLFFGPSLITMRGRKETWSSSGVTKHNLGKSLLLGVLLSTFYFVLNILTKKLEFRNMFEAFTPSHFWALATFFIVGISEEFGFRGYLQTRLVAWLGKGLGWAIASISMALAHIVQRITIMGMSETDAIMDSFALIPISLLLGYIMLRAENVMAGALFHTFIDWCSVL
jgi:membrane protease YdiL (CAAX protease family)